MGAPAERVVRKDPKLRQRTVYVQERIPLIAKELNELLAEKKSVQEKFSRDPKGDSEEAKQLRRRRLFLKARLQVLKDERRSLIMEKRSFIMERRQLNEKFQSHSNDD